jgi:YVTN family beta-propeller protein
MKKKEKSYLIILALTAFFLFLITSSSAQSTYFKGQYIYVTNHQDNNIYVIDTATNSITTIVEVGNHPIEVAVTPDGTKVYVINRNNVSVINTTTNTVITNISVERNPNGVTVSPDGTKVYVTINFFTGFEDPGNVSVIDTATNALTTTIKLNVIGTPKQIAIGPSISQKNSTSMPGTMTTLTSFSKNQCIFGQPINTHCHS